MPPARQEDRPEPRPQCVSTVRKIAGKGTGGREGYLLFFRHGMAKLSNPSREQAIRLGSKWVGLGESEKSRWRGDAHSLWEPRYRLDDGASPCRVTENEEELFQIFLSRIRKGHALKASVPQTTEQGNGVEIHIVEDGKDGKRKAVFCPEGAEKTEIVKFPKVLTHELGAHFVADGVEEDDSLGEGLRFRVVGKIRRLLSLPRSAESKRLEKRGPAATGNVEKDGVAFFPNKRRATPRQCTQTKPEEDLVGGEKDRDMIDQVVRTQTQVSAGSVSQEY